MTAPSSAKLAVGVSFCNLLAYNHSETLRWRDWFAKNPTAYDVPVGEKIGTVRDLIQHIFQAETWFTARLAGEDPLREKMEPNSLDELWAMHEVAHQRMTDFLASAGEEEMRGIAELPFEGGFKVSRRKLVTQYFLHGVHHWAQIAMQVRQAGIPSDGPHDYILSKAVE